MTIRRLCSSEHRAGHGRKSPQSLLHQHLPLTCPQTTGDETPKKAEEAHPPQAKRARKGQRARG